MRDFRSRLYDAYVTSGQANYSNDSDKIDLFKNQKYYINNTIKSHLSHLPKDAQIVDIACGNGSYVYFLQKAGFSNAFGFDISEEQIQLGRALGVKNIEVMDFNQFLADDNRSADVFLLMDILEHLERSELFSLLDELYLRLNKNGMLLIHIPNAEGIFGMRIRYGDLTHETSFTPKSMNQLLSTIGFKVIECFEDKPIRHGFVSFLRRVMWDILTIPSRLLLAAETGSLKFILSQNMLVLAKK